MPDRCIQCQQAVADIDVGVLRIQHAGSPRASAAPPWTISRRSYCQTCYRQAEQAQHQRNLARLWMALLPMMWFLVSGVLLYGGLYPNPATAPLEAHLFFLSSTFAAFYFFPAAVYRRFKRLDDATETISPGKDHTLASAVGNCTSSASSPSALASSRMGSESAEA